jgi:hypothetical protein
MKTTMMKYVALFGASVLVSGALIVYGAFAHGEQLLGRDMVPADDRPAVAATIADSCRSGAPAGKRFTPESFTEFCGCYADELLNIATVSDFKSIENGVTYKFQIKADRATARCETKVKLVSR